MAILTNWLTFGVLLTLPLKAGIRPWGRISPKLMRWMAGRKRAAAPIFCIKLEMTATAADNSRIMRLGLERAKPRRGLTPRLITPV